MTVKINGVRYRVRIVKLDMYFDKLPVDCMVDHADRTITICGNLTPRKMLCVFAEAVSTAGDSLSKAGPAPRAL